ncbi:uncharacterized membrane protein YtjA (UPF0391 family) [Rhodoblastus acidophilus]|uniref:DUF1328 family protein n=1 Tax=Rhodoblastus acidophilus TaxID=1074 RepID=UPI0022256BF7|nr:DUF1328 family protein [Rhodoblastus acidophilus]MCW2315467.1 uncharacterized membrane protein YtjA (UPF0391 family) [Rhodoblastus acidophilus]
MLSWTLVFLILALVAGGLGFGGLAATSAQIARVLFGLFLILFLATALLHLFDAAV